MLVEVEDDDRKVVLAAERDRSGIHHPQAALQDLKVADGVEHGGVLHQHRIVGVDAIDLGGLQDGVCLDLHGAQRCGGIGGKVRVAGAAGEYHDPAFLQVTDGAAPDEGLGDLVHLDGGHHAGENVLLLQRILQREGIDDGGQHAHVIGGDAVHEFGLLGHAAEEIAAANHDCDLDSEAMYLADFGGDLVDAGIVHTEALAGGQRFTGNFQEYAFINRSAHFWAKIPSWKSADSV